MAEEIENKGFDNPQQPEGNTTIAPKPNGVQNQTPTTPTTPTAPASSDGPTTSTDTPPVDTTATTGGGGADTAGSDRKIRTLRDFLNVVDTLETPDQRRKRERRERSEKIVSAISDGIQAISNLYFTSQYAPNAYNHEKGSGLNAQSAAIEKAKKDREANADRYLNFALALGNAENERAKTVREVEEGQERRKLAREKAQREADAAKRAEALFPDQQREQKGKADRAGYDAQSAQAKAGKAEELAQAEVDAKRAQGENYRASAQNSRASAASHGRANQAEFTAYDEKGGEHKFKTAAAAEAYARQHGTWQEGSSTTTTTMGGSGSSERRNTRTTTDKGGYSRRPAHGGDTPPSRRNSNDNRPPSRR